MAARVRAVRVTSAVLGTLLWWLLAGSLDAAEGVVGGVAVALAVVAVSAVRASRLAHFRARAWWLISSVRVAVDVARGIGVVGRALWLRVRGRRSEAVLQPIGFDPGGEDPRSAARRALVVGLTTMAPGTIVVDLDGERGALLVHRLEDGPVPAMARLLGARP